MGAQRVKMGTPRETKNETISKIQNESPTDSKNEKYVKNGKVKTRTSP